ncbi:MAG: ATP-binding cassette domain-containing protein [Oscillospiraceae bacterium]|nr:ATP-binding cassette domain-containing protein [Oscillospiraceae bacterium]
MGLVVKELHKRYGQKVVVDSLSFSIEQPGVYALLGTNGAGKTTAIRMMLGMLAKDGGQVFWNDKPLSIDQCNIGYLAEERGLYPKTELMDQLIYFASLRNVSKADAKQRIKYWAERLEAVEYLYPQQEGKRTVKPKKADQLSKGNQQKIQFMTALLSDPELIILDEPLSGLDPVNTDLFKSIIHEEINKGKYLIMSSHQMSTIEEFCTDLTILNRSKTVLQGNLADIKKSYGRINLFIKTEQEIAPLITQAGVTILSQVGYSYQCKVNGEDHANTLLKLLVDRGILLVAFELREPSLHEIFVEKVGEPHGEA